MLRKDNIDKQFKSNFLGSFIANFNQAIAIIFCGLVLLLLVKIAFGIDLFLKLIPLYLLVTRLMIIFIGFIFILYLFFAIIEHIQYKKYMKELFDRFFEIQTKDNPITLNLSKKTIIAKTRSR